MDTKEYISSGVIEAYVLGLASDEEVREVELYAIQYAEIKKAITDFEIALENQALQNAVPPPAFIKERIMAAIEGESSKTNPVRIAATTDQPVSSAKVVSLTAAPKSVRWLRGAVAASIILFLGSAILNFYYYSQYKKYSQQYNSLVAEQTTLLAQNELYRASFNMMNDTGVIKVIMTAASPKHSGSVATVYWNKKSRDVSLMVNNLPAPAAGKQYQLWAIEIINGKIVPTDAGMIESTAKTIKPFKMKKMGTAQKFAVTLEKTGGSPTPTLDQLYVIGDI